MTRAITVRLDEADHAALQQQADELKVRPGTLARILVHAGLARDIPAGADVAAKAAVERLVQRSRKGVSADVVALVADARLGLDAQR